jgi:hypothetical protein
MERKMTCPKCGAENLSGLYRCQHCGERLHKDEGELPTLEWRPRFPLLSGLIGTGALGFNLLRYVVAFTFSPLLVLLAAAPLVGLGLGRKWPLVGGVLLLLSGFVVLILVVIAVSMADTLGIALTACALIALFASGISLLKASR